MVGHVGTEEKYSFEEIIFYRTFNYRGYCCITANYLGRCGNKVTYYSKIPNVSIIC